MELDIGRILKKLTQKDDAAGKKELISGLAVSLGTDGHLAARFTHDKERVSLHDARTVTDDELRLLAAGAKSLALCFSPRSIYADLGDFSSVSPEATMAHIRSTVDKTGLFNEPYAVAFRKVYDLDNIRARFSYLAIPLSEVDRIGILDENETCIDSCCPVEASIAALVGASTPDMCVSLFEDSDYVRIVGSKKSVIYHLIAIDKQRAFDLFAETLAGVSEMSSLMKNTYGEAPKAIFTVGAGEITARELQESGIEAQEFGGEDAACTALPCFELMGNVHCTGYDFTPQSFRDTRTYSRLATLSLGVSVVMAAVAVALLLFGYMNFSGAGDYQDRTIRSQKTYVRNMHQLEGEYATLLKQLDLAHINELIALYQDFQSEPKLYTILGSITGAVPADLSITRVEIAREGLPADNGAATGAADAAMPPTSNPVFHITIAGKIAAQYPQSKILFSTFLSGVQAKYPVLSAAFSHTGDKASYKIECEAKK